MGECVSSCLLLSSANCHICLSRLGGRLESVSLPAYCYDGIFGMCAWKLTGVFTHSYVCGWHWRDILDLLVVSF